MGAKLRRQWRRGYGRKIIIALPMVAPVDLRRIVPALLFGNNVANRATTLLQRKRARLRYRKRYEAKLKRLRKLKMVKKHEPQTVSAAESVLSELKVKRDKLVAFGRELTEARRTHAYQAHAVHDPDAERELTM
jgi:hypothetical protein